MRLHPKQENRVFRSVSPVPFFPHKTITIHLYEECGLFKKGRFIMVDPTTILLFGIGILISVSSLRR